MVDSLCSKLAPLPQRGHRKLITQNVRNFWPALYLGHLKWPDQEKKLFQHTKLHHCSYISLLRFLNDGVLRNLNTFCFKKLYPVCSATWPCLVWRNMKGAVLREVSQWAGHFCNSVNHHSNTLNLKNIPLILLCPHKSWHISKMRRGIISEILMHIMYNFQRLKNEGCRTHAPHIWHYNSEYSNFVYLYSMKSGLYPDVMLRES